ncbi:MAG: PRD domain-containing protein, partial [Thomasclavelia ramosa]
MKEQYTELFTIVWYALSLIESRYNVILNDEEVSLI